MVGKKRNRVFGVEHKDQKYQQVCVWASTDLIDGQELQFEDFMKEFWGIRVHFLERFYTKPDMKNGMPVDGTGGRSDIFFEIHEDDIAEFALKRFSMDPPVRWIEDVLDNGHGYLYPEYVTGWRSW